MFVCFTDLPVVVKEWWGGGEIYLSEQRRTGDGEGREEGVRKGVMRGGGCAGKAAAGEGEKKNRKKANAEKRDLLWSEDGAY